jgi:hypothetical protein
MSSVNYNNNFHNFTNYGFNYYNDSYTSDLSEGYQSSISPGLNSCANQNGPDRDLNECSVRSLNQDDCVYYQSHLNRQDCNMNFVENRKPWVKLERILQKTDSKWENDQKSQKVLKNLSHEKMIENKLENLQKTIIVAPEVLKKRRTAANARERRRMNNLNFAFDRYFTKHAKVMFQFIKFHFYLFTQIARCCSKFRKRSKTFQIRNSSNGSDIHCCTQ